METTAKCISLGPADCRESYCIHSSALRRCISQEFLTLVSPEQAVVLETRSDHSLEEGGYRGGPSSRQGVRVLQPYFIVPKKDGVLRPILDLWLLNRSVMRLKFKMLTVEQVVSQNRSEDWFVMI